MIIPAAGRAGDAGTTMTEHQPTRAIPATPTELEDGRFVIGGMLGSGGMAVVVAAEDTQLERTVAVKLLADALAFDPDARERFSREARSMAALNHPNVVQVYDVGEIDQRPYFIMEHVPGGSLADRLKADGALPPDEVDHIAIQALRGLAHAHEAGLLHRDLKPANLLVGTDGIVKVTDFGVARAAESQTLTRTGIVLGTMRYLAPERLRGQQSTEASDLYGLASTLYELLTAAGIDPKKDAAPLKRLPSATSPALRTFLERALAEDPGERPASAREALDIWADAQESTQALTTEPDATRAVPVEHDAPTEAHPIASPTSGRSEPSWWDGNRRAILIGLTVVALLLALAAVSDPAGTTDGEPAPQDTAAPEETSDAAGGATTDDAGAPRGSTPEETARNLADWLRGLTD